jgi:hypothetical protein
MAPVLHIVYQHGHKPPTPLLLQATGWAVFFSGGKSLT